MTIMDKITNARKCLQVLMAKEAKAVDESQRLQARNSRHEMQMHLSELHRARREENKK